MMAPDHVLLMLDPNIADWSSKSRGGTVLQPVSEKKMGIGYPEAFTCRSAYPETLYDEADPHHSYALSAKKSIPSELLPPQAR